MSEGATYDHIRAPRWGAEENAYEVARSHPPYVFGTGKNCALVHKVDRVDLRWWTIGGRGDYLVRLQSPRMFARTVCGRTFFLDTTSTKTCAVPKRDSVPCGRCHGEDVNFPKNRPHKIPRSLAKVRLGCVVQPEERV